MIFSGGADSGWSRGVAHGPKNHRQEVLRPLSRLVIIGITIVITIVVAIVFNIKTLYIQHCPGLSKKAKIYMKVHNKELFVLLKSNKL